jgi:tRNA threonylcarbamoyladenosine dehydratase
MRTPAYADLFQRNIGVFTAEEQERIRGLVVAIAGAGGLGGPVAYNLARLGVGEIRLADPEVFEPSNTNRQWGCYADTIGMNKAEAVAIELRRINPTLVAKAWPCALGEDNVSAFLDGATLVVDGIEFFSLEAELHLHNEAAKRGLWVFTGQCAGEIMTFTTFDPSRPALQNMIQSDGQFSVAAAIQAFFPVLPHAATPEILASVLAGAQVSIPSHAPQAGFGGSLLVDDIIRQFVRGKSPRATAPDVYVVDSESLTISFPPVSDASGVAAVSCGQGRIET